MNFQPPSDQEFREAFLTAPRFLWPEFAHMPLNCFDMTTAVLTFPGDISKNRQANSSAVSGFQFDIQKLETCPNFDEDYNVELWNADSLNVRWFLGAHSWACFTDYKEHSMSFGFFRVSLSITRFQNMPQITDIRNTTQLSQAIRHSLQQSIESQSFQDYSENDTFTKTFNNNTWYCVRSLNGSNYPIYVFALPIDAQTVVWVSATLDNCWTYGEIIPEEVESKHLESMWDYLSQINLSYTLDESFTPGTTVREAPGQAEKMDDDIGW